MCWDATGLVLQGVEDDRKHSVAYRGDLTFSLPRLCALTTRNVLKRDGNDDRERLGSNHSLFRNRPYVCEAIGCLYGPGL
jgi:hypothetical protein